MTEPSTIVPFPQCGSAEWIVGYHQTCLMKRNETTIDAYLRILHQFTEWVAKRPGHRKQFRPEYLTTTVVEGYLSQLKEQGYSVSHRTRVKSVIKQFCQWLIDEKDVLQRNPARGIELKTQQVLAPRMLSPDQRFVLRNLVEKADNLRGKALFAFGYWAGCRVSDVAHLHLEHAPIGPKIGWLHVGYKGEKFRDIDLLNEARRPWYNYLQHDGRDPGSLYIFTSYLGHVTMKGTPAIQTTVRYTRVSRAQVKEKLRLMKG